MLQTIMIASGLIILTTAIHATGMLAVIAWSRHFHIENYNSAYSRHALGRPFMVSAAVLIMFLAAIIEVFLWAGTYQLLGAFDDLETAMYFSMVTFSTLGYGDIVLAENWRLLSSFQAANGVIIFGWTTAIVLFVVQSLYLGRDKSH